MWILGRSSDEGNRPGFMTVGDTGDSPDLATAAWKEYMNGTWADNPGIQAVSLATERLSIAGASAEHQSRMGVYRVAARLCDGKAAYAHVSGATSIWFHSALMMWILGRPGGGAAMRAKTRGS